MAVRVHPLYNMASFYVFLAKPESVYNSIRIKQNRNRRPKEIAVRGD